MANFNWVMVKTVRISGWPLLVLMIVYLVTGFALCGQISVGRWMRLEQALWIHRLFDVPLVVLFVAHSLPAVYLAFVRWGWIGKKNKS